MIRFFSLAALVLLLMAATHYSRVAARDGWGLDDEFSEVSVRNGSTHRGGRVYVGGGFHGGK